MSLISFHNSLVSVLWKFGDVCYSSSLLCLLKFASIVNSQHFGPSPLPAYEPAFDWENERSMIFGQRISEAPISQYGHSLLLLSFSF